MWRKHEIQLDTNVKETWDTVRYKVKETWDTVRYNCEGNMRYS